MTADGVFRLIAEHEAEIRTADETLAELERELSSLYTTRNDLMQELRALRQIGRRRGLPIDTDHLDDEETRPPEDWSSLTRVDAVEQVLIESADSLSLTEIRTSLQRHARTGDPVDSISGTLAHLKRARGTAISDGRGRWRYNPHGAVANRPHPQLQP